MHALIHAQICSRGSCWQAIRRALEPGGSALAGALADLQAVLEANQVTRAPKVAKGTRDFDPAQMFIRYRALQTITLVRPQGACL